MSAIPVWFGAAGRPSFGWLHVPDGDTARAAVLICPPVGYEYISSHRTLRTLAEVLAERGVVALRFDYDGTGDSAGDDNDPERLSGWMATIGFATDLIRTTGVSTVAAVGMRLGATLAAAAIGEGSPLDALILWDPIWSGRTMVRYLRALHQVGVGLEGENDTGDGSLDVAGARYSPETVHQLAELRFPDLSGYSAPTLVLTRPNDPVRAPFDRLPSEATFANAAGQEELLDRESSVSLVPQATLEAVAAWLDTLLPSPRVPITIPEPTIARLSSGVTERYLRLGSAGLFGITTEAKVLLGYPTIVLLNNATDHHIGPNRMWVDWGRHMATIGFRVARVDISGIGDSPLRPGQVPDRIYPPSRRQDVAEIAAELDDGNGVVLIGMCSGGRIAIDTGPDIGARGIIAINVMLNTPAAGLELITHEDPFPPIVAKAKKWNPVRHHLSIRLPKSIWKVLDRVGLVPSVCRPLLRVADCGVEALVIWGADEYGWQKAREKSRWALDELARRSGFRIELVPELDHAMMRGTARNAVAALMTAYLISNFASVSADREGLPGNRSRHRDAVHLDGPD